MFRRIAMLLPIFALPLSATAADAYPAAATQPSITAELGIDAQGQWTAERVAQIAAVNSAAANLIESERSAISSSISRDDPKQCAQVALMQNVQRELACYERSRSVAQALTSFYQLVHLERQQLLLDQARGTMDQLLRMADKADELELEDGNRFELDKRALQLADQQAEAAGANAKLRIALAQWLGRPFDEMATAAFVDDPAAATNDAADQSVEQWVSIAMSRRCDLSAIQTLCRSLSADSLPAARQLFGALQPGLGLAVALAARKPLLVALHEDDRTGAELCQRRQQCLQLQAARQSQIETQVRLAYVDRQTAATRVPFARQIADIQSQRV
ncbi:MAG: hypothetical protein ACO1RT_05095, partial [Planctomycetaceae bacterium]